MSLNVLAIDPIAFEIFGWPVRWYGVIIGMAILVGYIFFTREAVRKGIDSDTAFDVLFWTVIFGLVGARIYYVLFSSQNYLADPLSIFRVWEGGMAIYGGVIGGAITIYVLCQKYKINMIDMFDIAVPALMAGQLIGRWGNFMNQEAHGGPTTREFLQSLALPDFIINQMNINGTYYHPTFLYESLWNLVGVVILLILRPRKHFFKQGEFIAFYMMWYGVGRFWIEGLRTDSLYIGSFRVSQLLSLALILVGLVIVFWTRVKGKDSVPYYDYNRLDVQRNEGEV